MFVAGDICFFMLLKDTINLFFFKTTRYAMHYFYNNINFYNNIKKFLLIVVVCSILQIFLPALASSEQFFKKNHLIVDLSNGTEWMRCSVGQRWNGKDCIGEAVPLNHDDFPVVLDIAIEQLGPGWRLPTKNEL